MFLELLERFGDRPLELQIMACDAFFRCVLDVDVRRNTFVLDSPLVVAREESPARRDGRTTVDEGRCVRCVNETTPRPLADECADLPIAEHVRHEIAA